jgi:N-formylglutamate deformylase
MSSVTLGATLLIENYPRCYIDVNREESDIDPEVVADEWQGTLFPSEKSKKGLGLVRRYLVPGVAVNAGALTSHEIQKRIDEVYRPYHEALGDLVNAIHYVHGKVWHVDWHSMKSKGNAMTPDGDGTLRPDFVVSDNRGATSGPELVDRIVSTLRGAGYSVSINEPYAGGTIVKKFGRPEAGVHSVQIEINRALYLDEPRVEIRPEAERLVADIEHLTQILSR